MTIKHKTTYLTILFIALSTVESVFASTQNTHATSTSSYGPKRDSSYPLVLSVLENSFSSIGHWITSLVSSASTQKALLNQVAPEEVNVLFLLYLHSKDFQQIMTLLERTNAKNYLGLLAEETKNELFLLTLKQKPIEASKLFFYLLDSVNEETFCKNALLAFNFLMLNHNFKTLSEETQKKLRSEKYQKIIGDIFVKYLNLSNDDEKKKVNLLLALTQHFTNDQRQLNIRLVSRWADQNFGEQALQIYLPYLYDLNLPQFSEMIFSESLKPSYFMDKNFVWTKPSKIICNQEGYDEGVSISCVKGSALKLNEKTPIGYNVHLPAGDIKAVFTEVYGGHQAKNRQKDMSYPGSLHKLASYLLANGIAVVTLNLLDLREANCFQMELPKDIAKREHESINKYFEVFNNPELLRELHPDLLVVLNKPNFLFGGSFGGRTVMKQAEVNPGTFKGYISFNGALDFEVLDDTVNRNPSCVRSCAHEWLDPIHGINELQDPMLFLHTMDDNRVSVAASISAFQKCLEGNKSDKIFRLLLTSQGNALPLGEEDLDLKGHFFPESPEIFQRLADYVLQFILQGPSALSTRSELSAQMHKRRGHGINSYKGREVFRPEALLLSELFRHYYVRKQPKINEDLWQKEFQPIIESVFLLEDVTKSKIHNFSPKLLSDEDFARAIERQALGFAIFLIEKYRLTINAAHLAQLISESKAIHGIFAEKIRSDDVVSFKNYLLYELLRANPNLTHDLLNEYFQKSENAKQEFLKKAEDIKTIFLDDISQAEELAKKTWREAATKLSIKARFEKSQGSARP